MTPLAAFLTPDNIVIVERLGFPIAILAGVAWMIWKMSRFLGERLFAKEGGYVTQLVEDHGRLVNTTIETNKQIIKQVEEVSERMRNLDIRQSRLAEYQMTDLELKMEVWAAMAQIIEGLGAPQASQFHERVRLLHDELDRLRERIQEHHQYDHVVSRYNDGNRIR